MKRFLLSLLILVNVSIFSEQFYADIEVKKIVSVYDGDTFRVDLDSIKYPDIIGKHISVRIADIDTPELKSKNKDTKQLAIVSRDFSKKQLLSAKKIVLTKVRRDKYFRILAVVLVDGVDLSKLLLDQKLAKLYSGGSKSGLWE